MDKQPKELAPTVVRIGQEAANRLEAEQIRRSIRAMKEGKRANIKKGEILDELILSSIPPADSSLIDNDTESGELFNVTGEQDSTGNKQP